MGKKIKIGKQRRDKYYRLAKEAGLRSRAVFKLTQLNRKFEFLQRSQVLIDLCAAPGGWLQVAAKHMPVSSLIIGVDLVSIKPMPNIITLQNDITTEKCRQEIKAQLQTWLADCVLHDGAPNVGKNWGHDAFMQAQLTLSALKLATEVLKRGGWFVTKMFRSKDHPALVELFKKLFKKVYVTKPEASRSESSEIYAVCRGYLKPDKIDPKLLDHRSVFIDMNLEPEKPRLNLMKPEKRKRKAEGYAEGDYTLHHKFTARQFVESDKHLDLLADANQIVVEESDDVIAGHPSTTPEIRECCKDVKVLGRKELRDLLNWRKQIRQHLKSLIPKEDAATDGAEKPADEIDEEAKLDEYVASLKAEEKREAKKKRRKVMAEKRNLKKKLDLKMIIPGDKHDYAEEADLFSLKKIKNKEKAYGEMDAGPSSSSDSEYDVESEFELDDEDEDGNISNDAGRSSKFGTSLLMEDDETVTTGDNKTDAWFKKEIFDELVGDEDEDAEIERVLPKNKKTKQEEVFKAKEIDELKPDVKLAPIDEDSDTDQVSHKSNKGKHDDFEVAPNHDDFEVAPNNNDVQKLDAEGMALAELWIHSTKTRRDLIDSAYNRYTNNDDGLPDWFAADEKKHWRAQLPVTKEAVEAYRLRMKAINARPIKKVAEAKARKKKRGIRRAEKAKKRAEAVIENSDMTEAQKSQEMRKIYKQAMNPKKKKETTYVVAKKSHAGRRVHRPAGVQGRFKVVDPRMKKDTRAANKKRRR